jgi:hypothetical protein
MLIKNHQFFLNEFSFLLFVFNSWRLIRVSACRRGLFIFDTFVFALTHIALDCTLSALSKNDSFKRIEIVLLPSSELVGDFWTGTAIGPRSRV